MEILQFMRHLLAPGVLDPIAAITNMQTLGPMPEYLEEVPPDLAPLSSERHVNQAEIWDITMCYWPSHRAPPYTTSEGWVWIWHREGGQEVWEIVGLR